MPKIGNVNKIDQLITGLLPQINYNTFQGCTTVVMCFRAINAHTTTFDCFQYINLKLISF